MKKILIILSFLAWQGISLAQELPVQDTIPDVDPIVAMMDSLVKLNFMNRSGFADQLVKCDVPYECRSFSDYDYKSRLNKLNSIIPLDYNESVRNYIELYANRRPGLTSRMIGLSQLYFPLFEQVLDREGLPLEFKYLAVVESALNPVAVSKAGATGLWQFMYATGKMYNLKITSYVDERRDPYKATVAACQYFKAMYKIYNDWLLVIAAYNCGERNVNKAILRSGGKMNFWAIKRYLPQETQGYVPAFIAVNYVMNYYQEHGINGVAPPLNFYELDTVQVAHHVTFSAIASTLGMSTDEIHYLNPIYKKNFIPFTGEPYTLVLPSQKITGFVTNASAIYEKSTTEDERGNALVRYVTKEKKKTYTVRKGESLATIAKKHDCTVADIRQWNKLKSKSGVAPGKQLVIYYTVLEKEHETDSTQVAADTTNVAVNEKPSPPDTDRNKFVMYVVQPNDTLFSIARKFKGVTVEQLKELNKESLSNPNVLTPGIQLKVQVDG